MVASSTVYSACHDGDTDGDGSDWDQEPGSNVPPLPAPATDADISGIDLADLNGDGIDDLIVLSHGGYPSYVYLIGSAGFPVLSVDGTPISSPATPVKSPAALGGAGP